jgi:5-methylcytosine-specific restriction endonuclease McrA
MARPSGPKTRCNGQWTEARYRSFVQSLLRQGTRKWAPINETKKQARVARGFYRCAGCKEDVPLTVKEGRKKSQNIFVDHINPVVDPEMGFTTWDDYIEGMFSEMDNLQVLCKKCHDIKSANEREVAANRRKKERDQ